MQTLDVMTRWKAIDFGTTPQYTVIGQSLVELFMFAQRSICRLTRGISRYHVSYPMRMPTSLLLAIQAAFSH